MKLAIKSGILLYFFIAPIIAFSKNVILGSLKGSQKPITCFLTIDGYYNLFINPIEVQKDKDSNFLINVNISNPGLVVLFIEKYVKWLLLNKNDSINLDIDLNKNNHILGIPRYLTFYDFLLAKI